MLCQEYEGTTSKNIQMVGDFAHMDNMSSSMDEEDIDDIFSEIESNYLHEDRTLNNHPLAHYKKDNILVQVFDQVVMHNFHILFFALHYD